ncbi:MAG: bacteriorhodopsin [Verrucomicrobia bacterium]|nr:bacteriorhodopsin [Verrucomicrobiota bacterium]
MIPNLTGLQQVVHFTFIMTFMGMIAASAFFLIERSSVAPGYRSAISVSGLICGIAALNYFYMKDIYIVGIASGTGRFPTEFRYIDWILTVPLMLVKFPTLLGLGPKGRQFLTVLVTLALLMLVTGFIGEINPGTPTVHYGLFGVGCVAWLLIIALLFFALGDLPEGVDEIKRRAIKRMALFVMVGWIIYPVGYLAPLAGFSPDVRELTYNIGDLINKVGLAIMVLAAGIAQRKADEEALEEAAA